MMKNAGLLPFCAGYAALLCAVLGGCRNYQPQPLELDAFARSWERWTPAASELSETPAGETLDLDDGLTLAEAETLARWINPDLRVARARAGVPLATARQSGLLDDPSFSLDVLRILENVSNPWIVDIGLGFTIPLSGRLGADRDRAWAAYTAEWLGIVADENETIAALRTEWAQHAALHAERDLIASHLTLLHSLGDTAQRLAEAGEIRTSEARVLNLEQQMLQSEIQRLDAAITQQVLAIKEIVGLTPFVESTIDPSFPVAPPIDVDRRSDSSALLVHPSVVAAEAAYEESEQALRLEIARTWPDLTIGPAYANEEGQSRIGFGFGFPIPILNANRQAIAEAFAARNATRAEAERTFQRLATRVARAEATLAAASARAAFLIDHVRPLVDAQTEEIRRLASLGEIDVLLLTDALARSLTLQRDLLAAQSGERAAMIELSSLLQPEAAAHTQHLQSQESDS